MKHRIRIIMLVSLIALLLITSVVGAQDDSPKLGVTRGADSHEGYTLFKPQAANNVLLIDSAGRVVHDWTVSGEGRDAILRENGNLVVSSIRQDVPTRDYARGARFVRIDGRFEEYDWDGNLLWAYEFDREGYQIHHGIEVMPNGNIMFIAWEYITDEEAVAAGRDPELIGDGLWPDVLLEYSPELNEIVWEWHVWDHMIQDFDETQDNYGVVSDHPELIDVNFSEPANLVEDWQHGNAIDYHPALDQLVFSPREFNEFWIIDHSTTTEEAQGPAGDLMYRWGNPRAYGRGEFEDRQISYQHDVRWVQPGYPGAGNITVYSNRHSFDPEATIDDISYDAEYSTVIEMTPPLLPDGTYELIDGEPYGPAEATWMYDGLPDNPYFSNYISGAQRTASGNTLITVGSVQLIEVSPDGELLWEYFPPFRDNTFLMEDANPAKRRAQVFRARRYEEDYPGLAGRDLSTGLFPYEMATTAPAYTALMEQPAYESKLSPDVPTRYYAIAIANATVAPLTLTVEVLEGDVAPILTLTTPGKDVLAADENSDGELTAQIEGYIPDNVGWLYVTVSSAEGADIASTGQFRITQEFADPLVDVDEAFTPLQYGESVELSLTEDAPEGWVVFFGKAGHKVTLHAEPTTEAHQPVVDLLDANQDMLASSWAPNEEGIAELKAYELPETGLYYVRTTRYLAAEGDPAVAGEFELTITLEAN